MEPTSSALSASLPLYLITGGVFLLLVLLYLIMRARKRTKSEEPSARAEEKRIKTPPPGTPGPVPRETRAPVSDEKREEKPSSAVPSKGGLPVHDKPIPETEGVTRESFGAFAGRQLLIVEDNPVNVKLILKLLEGSGLEIETAADGQQALGKLRAPGARYEMVLMDVNMPKMDGLECTRQIRQDSRLRETPVVALTASTQKDEVERILESGMNGYLDKPLVLGKLYSALKLFLGDRPRRKAERVMVSGGGVKEGLVTNAGVLDIQVGLEHTNNNEPFYRSLLEEFLNSYNDCEQRFEQLLDAKDYEELHRLFVDLDGLTGALGAMELYGLIDRLKQIIEKEAYPLLEDYRSECHEAYQRFRREARRYLVH